MSGLLSRLLGRARAGTGKIDYERAKELAANESAAERGALAARTDVEPEILYFLAEDSDVNVRRAVASNTAAPVHVGSLLAEDDDEDVRCNLAQRIGQLAPQLDPSARERVGHIVGDVLETLARDQLPRVRQILAEELKDSDVVPISVVDRLARDKDMLVSAPILEFSPLLDDDTLLDIIQGAPESDALAAISSRGNLSESVSEAVVASDDEQAVAALLSNQSAQIREETLDVLVENAPSKPSWHKPLARRPALSQTAIRRLSEFVASNLLRDLERRRDIDSDTAMAINDAMKKRLIEEETEDVDENIEEGEDRELADEKAKRLYEAGELDEESIIAALNRGERGFVTEALALMGEIPVIVVSKAVAMNSAKGMTAVAWKAGLSMNSAVELQLRLARVEPSKAVHPRPGREFPMSDEDMLWQINFFGGQ
ncbi:MAG: hypothetical protein CMM52_09980 [Rhodospirillaceae bacterium]|nr:hypothetical protein [Rhodospirillaceae bacterium]|tara:strand:- start:143607 stop:144893 length:1287 start_codon:yes stop_codon:yes gene_type:complete